MALREFRGQDAAGAFTKAARGDQVRRDQTGSSPASRRTVMGYLPPGPSFG